MTTRWYDPPVAISLTFSAHYIMAFVSISSTAPDAKRAYHTFRDVEGGFSADLVGDEVEISHVALALFRSQFFLKFFA